MTRLMLNSLLQIRINFMRIRIQNFDPVVFPLAAFVIVRAKMLIPDPDFFPYRIPEPGAKKHWILYPDSWIQIYHYFLDLHFIKIEFN